MALSATKLVVICYSAHREPAQLSPAPPGLSTLPCTAPPISKVPTGSRALRKQRPCPVPRYNPGTQPSAWDVTDTP